MEPKTIQLQTCLCVLQQTFSAALDSVTNNELSSKLVDMLDNHFLTT